MDFDDFAFGPDAPPVPASSQSPAPQAAPQPPSAPEMALPPPGVTLGAPLLRQRSPTAARAKAGLGAIVAAAGAGAGAVVLGGPLGALAGLTAIGTARNLYRSQGLGSTDPTEKADAARSFALAVVGVAIVGYLGYRIYNRKES